MFTSTFIFQAKTYDEEFHRLNDEIARQARAIPGFLGEEEWSVAGENLHAEVYYWATKEAMQQLIGLTVHREAKDQHERWIGEYRVVLSEVISIYGNATLALSHTPDHS